MAAMLERNVGMSESKCSKQTWHVEVTATGGICDSDSGSMANGMMMLTGWGVGGGRRMKGVDEWN